MNYDFITNWKTEIMPLLDNEELQTAIKKGIQSYLKSWRNRNKKNGVDTSEIGKYSKNKLPVFYSKKVGQYEMCEMGKEEDLEIELWFKGVLKEDILAPNRNDYIDDCEHENALEIYLTTNDGVKYEKYKQKILKPYMEEWRKNNYHSYCLYGGCYWWSKTFSLTLAKLLMPSEVWGCIENDIHSIITNEDKSKVFDILCYNPYDDTFGGKEALYDATYEGTRKEWYMKKYNLSEEEFLLKNPNIYNSQFIC